MSGGDRAARARVVANFVDRYGADGLRELIELLQDAESGQRIAERFSVSRERVRQWKNAFGRSVTLYQPYPEVSAALRDP